MMDGGRIAGLFIALVLMVLVQVIFDASPTEDLILYFVVAIFWETWKRVNDVPLDNE